jgi:hypothetical protein
LPISELPGVSVFQPYGWEGIDAALAWVAFGTALPIEMWDTEIYFGASEWADRDPIALAAQLKRWPDGDDQVAADSWIRMHAVDLSVDLYRQNELETRAHTEIIALHDQLVADFSNADAPFLKGYVDRYLDEAMREHGRRLGNQIMENPSGTTMEERHRAILQASEAVRMSAAQGSITIYGWVGEGPNVREFIPYPRAAIPSADFAAPVSIALDGVRPYPQGPDRPKGYQRTYSGLMIDGRSLTAAFPVDAKMHPISLPAQERSSRKGVGGHPGHLARDWFIQELSTIAQTPDGLPEDPTELKRLMMDRLSQRFGDAAPSASSVADWLQRWGPRPIRKTSRN